MKLTMAAGLGLLMLIRVGWGGPAAAEPLTVVDQAKRQVVVPGEPERIVALGPGALRLMVYLQAQNKVVGVEEMEKKSPIGRPYWLANPELAQLPTCSPGGPAAINKKPDLEALISVQPQVIFVTYMDAELADEIQRTLKVPVVVLSYGPFATFDDTVYEALTLAAKVLNRAARAQAVVSFIENSRKELARRSAGVAEERRPGAYVGGIGFRGTRGIESSENNYAPFKWVGVVNLADSLQGDAGSHVFAEKETLLQLDPPTIFIDAGGLSLVAEDYAKNPRFYQALSAFAQGRVFTLLPFTWYVTNIGTILADAYTVGKIFYPERFADVDVQKKADEIYTFLVGKPVYSQMEKDYNPLGQPPAFLKGKQK